MTHSKTAAHDLAKLFHECPDPVYVLDEERVIRFCNPALEAWTGVAGSDLIGRRVDYYSGDPASGPPGIAAGLCPPPAAFAGEATTGHVSCMSASGRLLHRRARFLPLGQSEGDCVGVLGFLESSDSAADQLPSDAGGDPTADQLHVEIGRFRASQARRYAVEQLLGKSPAIGQARSQVAVAASSGATTLVAGPPGSGRAHVAHAIHYQRLAGKVGRLVPLECPLVDGEILRTTLAALERTNTPDEAVTLLLVHVDELSDDAQASLADFLRRPQRHLAILSTSRTRLRDLAEVGEYRRDVACALSTLEIVLPPLADRSEDLPVLAQCFLEEANRAGGKQVGEITADALDILVAYSWPGNLDELGEMIRAAHQAAEGHQVHPADLPARLRHAAHAAEYPRRVEEKIVFEDYLRKIEQELVTRALRKAKGNKTKAADLLGMSRARFHRRIVQLGLAEREGSQ